MAEVEIKLEAEIVPLKGKGSRAINKYIKDVFVPLAMEVIAEEIKKKARENSSGLSLPVQRLPNQATHPIGQSDSGNTLTGFLEHSIEVKKKAGSNYSIVSTASYASWVEFGTGIFGSTGHPIVPVEKEALLFTTPNFGMIMAHSVKGQPPNPFMRGAVWYVQDNTDLILKKINDKLRK